MGRTTERLLRPVRNGRGRAYGGNYFKDVVDFFAWLINTLLKKRMVAFLWSKVASFEWASGMYQSLITYIFLSLTYFWKLDLLPPGVGRGGGRLGLKREGQEHPLPWSHTGIPWGSYRNTDAWAAFWANQSRMSAPPSCVLTPSPGILLYSQGQEAPH